MSETMAELRELDEDELIKRHDRNAKNAVVGLQHYLDELRYREQSRIVESTKTLTKYIFWLTLVVTVATIFNVAVALGVLLT